MKKFITLLLCLSVLSFYACAWWDTGNYYAEHETTAKDIWHHWGEPLRVETFKDGTQKWIYFLDDPEIFSEIYFLIRNDRVINAGIN